MEQAEQAPQQGPQLSPKAQEMFRRLMLGAMKKLYADPKVTQGLVQSVGQAKSPQEGIVQATQIVVREVAQAAEQKGIPPEVSQRISPMVAALVAELAIAAGVVSEEQLGQPQEQEQPPAQAGLIGGAMAPQEA